MIKNQSLGGRSLLVAAFGVRRFGSCQSAGLLASVVLLLLTASSNAAVINYPNMSGASVDFTAISENTHDDSSPLPYFGAPVVSGDALDFTPINFTVNALVGPGFDSKDGFLTFMAKSKNDTSIQNIKFAEGGGLGVLGFGTDATFVNVSLIGFVKVIEIDGLPLPANTAIPVIPFDISDFSFGNLGNGSWGRQSDGLTPLTIWTGDVVVDITQELIDRGIPFVKGATKITVALDNALYAQAEAGGGARIDKKDFFTVTVNTPEPTSCLMALVGLAFGMVAVRRSR